MREVGRDLTGDWTAPPSGRRTVAADPRLSPPPADEPLLLPETFATRLGSRTTATRRRARGARPARRIVVATAVVAAVGVFLALTDGGRTRAPASLLPELDTLLSRAGFGLDLVTVSGHRFTPDLDILEALDLAGQRTWARFDTGATRERIERLPWIATASLVRLYPGRLDVRVTERTAWAVWRHGERETLIDATGRPLSDIRPGTRADLPRFAGEGAAAEAPHLATALDRHPRLARRVAVAERVAGRRWTLRLDNGAVVHLPADREAQALAGLAAQRGLERLLATPGRVLDLRTPGRIAVRTAGVAGAALPSRATQPAHRLASGEP